MEPSSEQHNHQEMDSQTLESMLACTKVGQVGKKPRPADMQALKCPRCESSNTKFCYYNNYSLSQPRYFCKSCRRYWTKGGTLRNVPVGGGCRKNTKRSSTSSTKRLTQLNPHHLMLTTSSPSLPSYDSTGDLSLAIARLHQQNPGLGPLDEPNSLSSIWGGNDLGPGHLGPPFDSGLLGDSSSGQNNNNNKYCGGMGGMAHEMGLPFGNFGGGMKPVNRGMMWGGLSWQGAGVDGNGADLNAGRALGWSGLGSSTWHGLLNSPLM